MLSINWKILVFFTEQYEVPVQPRAMRTSFASVRLCNSTRMAAATSQDVCDISTVLACGRSGSRGQKQSDISESITEEVTVLA